MNTDQNEQLEEEDSPTNGLADMYRYIGIGAGWMFAFIGVGICFAISDCQISYKIKDAKPAPEATNGHTEEITK